MLSTLILIILAVMNYMTASMMIEAMATANAYSHYESKQKGSVTEELDSLGCEETNEECKASNLNCCICYISPCCMYNYRNLLDLIQKLRGQKVRRFLIRKKVFH